MVEDQKRPESAIRRAFRIRLVVGVGKEAIVAWIIIWPVIMFLLFLVIEAPLVSDAPHLFSSSISPARTAFFFVATAMVILCAGIGSIFSKIHREFLLQGRKVLRVYMWLGIIFSGMLLISIPDSSSVASAGINTRTTSRFSTPLLRHDPTLVADLQQVGARSDQIDIIDESYVNSTTQFSNDWTDQAGEYTPYLNQVTGKFLYGKLTIIRGQNPNQERTDVAHEYLHHVWYALLDDQTKDRLTSDLISMYGNDAAMRQRTVEYTKTQKLQPTELFSYYCTEAPDAYLTQYVLDECNQYIHRGALSIVG